MNRKCLVEELRPFLIFSMLSEKDLRCLADIGRLVSGEAGDILISEDGSTTEVCLVLEGRAEVFLNAPKQKPEVLASLNPGELFGEIVLVENQRRSASIVAKTQMTMVEWKKDQLWEVFEQNPNIGFRMLHEIAKSLAKRLAATNMSLRRNLR